MTGGESRQLHALELRPGALSAAGRSVEAARLLDDSPEVISRLAHDGTFLYTSRAASELFGRSPEELVGTVATNLLEPTDRKAAVAKLVAMRDGRRSSERLTGQVRRPDGSTIWTDSSASVAFDPDTGERTILVVTRRADETMETERALRRLEERFRELVEWVPAVFYESDIDVDGNFIYISPQLEQLVGYTPEEWLADPALWDTCLHPEDRERVIAMEAEEADRSTAGGDRMIASEYRLIRRDGEVIQVRDVARTTGPPDGPRFWRGVLVNVTAERSAELTLREAHDSYRRMVDGLPACVYRAETGHNGSWVFVSSQIERLLGYTPDEMQADPTLWAASLRAEDRERVERAEAELTEEPPGTQYVNEYRMRTRTGKMIWVRDRAVLTESADGRLMMDGLLTDITAERHTLPAGGAADIYRVACEDCGHAWAAERLEPCPGCGGINVDGVSLNATLNELATSRQQVEGLLDGIHRHLETLGTNLRTVSDQLTFPLKAEPLDKRETDG